MRLDLTDEALATLEGTVDMEESENYVLVKDAAKHAGLNPNTIQQAISRGVYRGRKVGGARGAVTTSRIHSRAHLYS